MTLASNQASTEDPGTTATYDLTLTNDGNLYDTFDIDYPANSKGWQVSATPPSAGLNPGASTIIQVKVKVPGGATAGVLNQITVRATSQSDGAVQDIATLETTVALAPGVTVTPDNEAGASGGSVMVYDHTVTNTGNGTETFLISTASSLGWSTSVSPPSVALPKDGSTTIQVYVWVPGTVAPGTPDVTMVTAASQSDGSVSDSATDTTTRQVLPYFYTYLPMIAR